MFRALGIVSDLYTVAKRYVWKQGSDHHQTNIDPLSTIVRLALFSEKPSGTKISITDRKIYFHEAQALQGAFRKLNGDQRDDLHSLYQPIICACKWYAGDSALKPIFKLALRGIIRLEILYQDSPVICQCLSLYQKTIEKALNEQDEFTSLIKAPHMSISEDSTIDDRIRSIWTNNRIGIIGALFYELQHPIDRDDITPIMKTIDLFLEPIDAQIHRLFSGLMNH